MFVSCAYHQIEDHGGVDNNGFEQQLGVIVFGFISQTVQFLVVAPVSRQQLGLLITAKGLKVEVRGTNSKRNRDKRCIILSA